MPTWSRTFPRNQGASFEARRFVSGIAQRRASTQMLDDVLLMTSELVANTVLHVKDDLDDSIEVIVAIEKGSLTVTVRDPGPGFDPREQDRSTDQGGWGLLLVKKLSSRWGVTSGDAGTDVWFQIDAPR